MPGDPVLAVEGFELVEELPPGRYGPMARARQQHLGREVILKVLDPPEGGDPDAKARFEREAKVAARLSHPNVVRLIAFGTCARTGVPYLAFEWVDGLSLEQLLLRERALSERATLGLAQGVLEALRAAEEVGLVHRDVCPANLTVAPDGSVKLIDLGLARGSSDEGLTRPGVVLGTPRYAAPELLLGEPVDIRTDLFSLGVVLWHCLVGRPPFEEKEFLHQASRLVNEDVPDVRAAGARVGDGLARLVGWLCAREPGERYPGASAAAADVQRLLEGAAPLGPAEAGGQELPRTGRRVQSPELAALVGSSDLGALDEGDVPLIDDEPIPTLKASFSSRKESAGGFVIEARRGDAVLVSQHFEQENVIVGRGKDVDLRVDVPAVSRRHVAVACRDGQLVVTPLSNTNPTAVAGRRIQLPTPVRPGDPIELAGEVRLTVRLGPSAGARGRARGERVAPASAASAAPAAQAPAPAAQPAAAAPAAAAPPTPRPTEPAPSVPPLAPGGSAHQAVPAAAGPQDSPRSGTFSRIRIQLPSEPVPTHDLEELLAEARRRGASDLHLAVGLPPMLRINGDLVPQGAPLDEPELAGLATQLLTPAQREAFSRRGDLDLCYVSRGSRYRTNLCLQRTGVAISARIVAEQVPNPEELGLPAEAARLTTFAQGLVLVSGPLGAGKTTSLMSLVQLVNRSRPDHIITVEDPIEFLLDGDRCQVSQRELGVHTASFEAALRGALREDPDVIVIGDLRDGDTASLAVQAAETGHLVFASMPALSAAKTLDKLIDLFPSDEQAAVRIMVSESLRGVLCQRLLPGRDGGRVLACELLLNSVAVANIIREGGAVSALQSAMQLGKGQGMRTLEESLATLERAGTITPAAAAAVRRG